MTTISDPPSTPRWQREKHLQSGDAFWILTDIYRYTEKFYVWSEPQEMFRVGILDLTTGCYGYANFGRDIAFAILKAGIGVPPWTSPLPVAIELHRDPHEDEEKGRYRVSAKLLPLDPDVALIEPEAKRVFASFTPNTEDGMWNDLLERVSKENRIETAIESMRAKGIFSAGDIKRMVGKDVDVTPILKRLVSKGVLLPPKGKKRGTRYLHAPLPIIERADWNG